MAHVIGVATGQGTTNNEDFGTDTYAFLAAYHHISENDNDPVQQTIDPLG